jgi:gamma-glutamyl phosphate reductase
VRRRTGLDYGDADGTHPGAEQETGHPPVSPLGLPSIDRLSSLPADLHKALGTVPEIAKNTALLRNIARLLEQVAGDTDALLGIRKDMAQVAKATGVLGAMDDRMAAIEEAMPVLVEVQRHLAELPETVGQLLTALDELNRSVDTLQGAVEPMGRLANRVPGRKKSGPTGA